MQKLNIDKEFKDLIPPLSKDEYDALEQSILSEGCRDAIVTWQGTIIDGHNRYKICEKHGIPFTAKGMDFNSKEEVMLWMIGNQLARRNISAFARTTLELKSDEIVGVKERARENQREAGRAHGKGIETQSRDMDLPDSFKDEPEEAIALCEFTQSYKNPIDTKKTLAKKAGIGEQTANRVMQINKAIEKATAEGSTVAGQEPEEFKDRLMSGEVSINKAYTDIKNAQKKAELQAKIEEQLANPQESKSVNINEIESEYDIISADPPWSYNDKRKGHGGAEDIYPTMSVEDLCKMPVGKIAKKNAVLFLWATPPMLVEALQVMEAWGFKYKQHFVWDKVKPFLGHYNSCNHELLLIGVRGNFTPQTNEKFDSVQVIEKTTHSAKPEEFRKIIEALYPVGKKIELFAREAPEGWDVFGNMV